MLRPTIAKERQAPAVVVGLALIWPWRWKRHALLIGRLAADTTEFEPTEVFLASWDREKKMMSVRVCPFLLIIDPSPSTECSTRLLRTAHVHFTCTSLMIPHSRTV